VRTCDLLRNQFLQGEYFILRAGQHRTISGAEFDNSKERNRIMKPQKDKNDKKDTDIAAGSSLGLSIGLSLGVFFGIVTDNLGLCMMIGVAVGLCGGSLSVH